MIDDYELNICKEITVNDCLVDSEKIELFIGLPEDAANLSLANSYALIINLDRLGIYYSLLYCHESFCRYVNQSSKNLTKLFPAVACAINKILFGAATPDGICELGLKDILQNLSKDQLSEIKKILVEGIIKSGKYNIGAMVGIDNISKGNILLSCDFGPCRAVLAVLNNNQFVLYHAFSAIDDESIKVFLSLIQGNAAKVYIFQKTNNIQPEKQKLRAPWIALNLKQYLSEDIEIKVVEFDNYRHIVCSAEEKKIYLVTSKVKLERLQDDKFFKHDSDSLSSVSLSALQFKSIEQCLLEVFAQDDIDFTINNAVAFNNSSCVVQHKLLEDTARFILKQSSCNSAQLQGNKFKKSITFFEKHKKKHNQDWSIQDCLKIIFHLGLNKEIPEAKNIEQKKCILM